MDVRDLTRLAHRYPVINKFKFKQIALFICLATDFKHDIAAVHPSSCPTEDSPPPLLSIVHAQYLCEATCIPYPFAQTLWDIAKNNVWSMPSAKDQKREIDKLYKTLGWHRGITRTALWPHNTWCNNYSCPRQGELCQLNFKEVVVFTLDGVQRAKVAHLYCPSCCIMYCCNYRIHDQVSTHTYYDHIPKWIEMNEHHYIETKLVEEWTSAMVISATSASACVKQYMNMYAHRGSYYNPDYFTQPHLTKVDTGVRFSPILTTEQVWDAFVILALLRDHHFHSFALSVPNTGLQRVRFNGAMDYRNKWITPSLLQRMYAYLARGWQRWP
ncbi:hypothetical protein CONPUDRAFT_51457 [Coniophora puteana RWD-64-598 SS2]|uniref:CxC5 like cysteine cluster associated with KDZ domain-containing protein n=1 Tax=Coniophora puteana (strain RWD-64-598) TaxID=741705 RepID=A0A5M3MYE2_CONPW|nr:uncharacterized protein CONPUDRAFT_51457 [Coniophora puteana RWD-64-598 SS2]EIW84150.1 hypothetical protein CONPUDRAFT_51457 [Coniophora puteana RWD-64-598 SS2]